LVKFLPILNCVMDIMIVMNQMYCGPNLIWNCKKYEEIFILRPQQMARSLMNQRVTVFEAFLKVIRQCHFSVYRAFSLKICFLC
jgi:hypothetical protein